MKKMIIDTNIAFSAMLNINSRIGQILISGNKFYNFISPAYLRTEMFKHRERIKTIGKLTENEFIDVYELVTRNITMFNHSLIPREIYKKSEELCIDIDPDDTAFVAMGMFTGGRLWTGDKRLLKGLTEKGYKDVITTEELYVEFISKENKSRR